MKLVYLAGLVIAGFLLAGCNINMPRVASTTPAISPLPSPVPSPLPLDMTGWKSFTEQYYHLSFKLPPSLANQAYADQKIPSVNGEKGSVVCFELGFTNRKHVSTSAAQGCSNSYWMAFVIGGDSVDYTTPGRSGSLTDMHTFRTENGKHYIYSGDMSNTALESYGDVIATDFTNAHGLQILMIEDIAQNRDGIIPGLNGDALNAIVKNPSNATYPGFGVMMKKSDVLTAAVFRQILETFEIKS